MPDRIDSMPANYDSWRCAVPPEYERDRHPHDGTRSPSIPLLSRYLAERTAADKCRGWYRETRQYAQSRINAASHKCLWGDYQDAWNIMCDVEREYRAARRSLAGVLEHERKARKILAQIVAEKNAHNLARQP